MSDRPKVYDCFTYFDEIEHLEARLELLRYSVDGFIVCEGTHTHQGEPKPLHLDGVDLPDNVIRLVADLGSYTEPWDREHAQRDYIGQYIWSGILTEGSPFNLDDIITVCDVDEILNPRVVDYLPNATRNGPVALAMKMYYYGLSWEDPGPSADVSLAWLHPRAMRIKHMPASLSELRESAGSEFNAVVGGGWHISYWGGPWRRAAKLRAYAHAEQNNPETHALMKTADATGIGPNGEELVAVTDWEGIPDALTKRFL
jgi:beta-1,4-mannosyl-glycoprotein beta-1,4-N-acetylglucosaminyltransferase